LDQTFLEISSWKELLFRLAIALLFGAIVGWEREIQDKPAGLRTHMLVSLGAALIVQVPIQLGIAKESPDAFSRVLQGVVSGVGFLGAGAIIRESERANRAKVRGLTTAAAIWVSAGLGIIAGCGLWVMGAMGVIFAWLILWLFKKIEQMHR
jgi:putative Mg2+ transporter-C (MgtC) family protein